ncbi:hypothetical protein [Streptomyces sp. VRA16 Mangrove soil]|uniref:hypothetical protein n=1 Tax=Streptomyces sp. VRA16 Mangrove soil TaxID=2817434 RepID=UPI001A9E34FF|nr:hypothetical protein [Streptomyces sp. VRA16 Mangrove soil]MBO1329754.1 hypothetical protein [Streptomyces sp. VRA16 Mangrove soil]
MSDVSLWCGVAAFCAAAVALEVHAVRHSAQGPRHPRFAFLADRIALLCGIFTFVLWLLLLPADMITAWATGIFWGLAVCSFTYLARSRQRTRAVHR